MTGINGPAPDLQLRPPPQQEVVESLKKRPLWSTACCDHEISEVMLVNPATICDKDERDETPAARDCDSDRMARARKTFHAVHFYKDPQSLSQVAASFLCEGIGNGERVVVVSTPTHLAAIVKAVERRGVDLVELKKRGKWLAFDARRTLSTLITARRIDLRRFKTQFTDVVGDWYKSEPALSMRAYGEMVDLLYREGDIAAALKLEELWTDLAALHKFPLLCAYAVSSFHEEPSGSSRFSDVCRCHSHVIGAIPQRAS